MSQDAGLGRGTESPYLDILNHLGIQFDENAPMGVSDEEMRIIGPDIWRCTHTSMQWHMSMSYLPALDSTSGRSSRRRISSFPSFRGVAGCGGIGYVFSTLLACASTYVFVLFLGYVGLIVDEIRAANFRSVFLFLCRYCLIMSIVAL